MTSSRIKRARVRRDSLHLDDLTGRQIRLLGENVAIVHGSEENEVEKAGERFPVRYIYMDAVVKRSGKWQIVASQLAKPVEIQ